jgi:hypothetical protein
MRPPHISRHDKGSVNMKVISVDQLFLWSPVAYRRVGASQLLSIQSNSVFLNWVHVLKGIHGTCIAKAGVIQRIGFFECIHSKWQRQDLTMLLAG